MKEEIAKKKYEELKLLDQQIQVMHQQLEKINEQFNEINLITSNLESLKNIKGGEEILIPLANGIFIKGKIEKSNKVIMNIGSAICVPKTIDEAKTLMQDQVKDISNYRVELITRLEALYKKGELLDKDAEEIIKDV